MDLFADNWREILTAFGTTIEMTLIAAFISLVVGAALGAMRVSPVPLARTVSAGYVYLVRNTPLLLIMLILAFGLPELDIRPEFHLSGLFGFDEKQDLLELNVFFVFATAGLGFYTAAFVCEAVRSGINSIPLGQAEAARAVGMTFGQTLRLVILPQAFRAVIPPLTSTMIAMTKNSSVAAGVGVTEATYLMRKYTNDNGEQGVRDLRRLRDRLHDPRRTHLGAGHAARTQGSDGLMSNVLFDAPGPKARARHRAYGVVFALVLAGALFWVVTKLADADQFESRIFDRLFQSNVWSAIGDGVVATLKAAALGIAGALTLGFALALARLSDHAWLRVPARTVIEFFRAVPLLLLIIFAFALAKDVSDLETRAPAGAVRGAEPLQRCGARRGLPCGCERRAPRPVRGRVRDRDAQVGRADGSSCCRRPSASCCPRSSASAWSR